MGTHPIFESDFDCLTDQSRIQESCLSRSKRSRSSSTLLEERTPPLSRLSETSTTPSSRSDARYICTLLSLTTKRRLTNSSSPFPQDSRSRTSDDESRFARILTD